MLVCLVRKLADCIDGVDVAPYRIGDVIDLPERQAELLLAEGWGVVDRRKGTLPFAGRERRFRRNWSRRPEPVATAADRAIRPAQDGNPPNLRYDDCEERESRIGTTIDQHRAERRKRTRRKHR
jgi:hypothetical protein